MPERSRAAHEEGMRRFLETGERRLIGETVELVGLRRGGEEFPLSLWLVGWHDRTAARTHRARCAASAGASRSTGRGASSPRSSAAPPTP